MAYPPLHRKLYKNDGAGPELKEEIVPHELTKKVTAPSFTLTANDKIWHNSVTNEETGYHWEEFYFSMGDDETKSPRIVFRGNGCDGKEDGDNAVAGSVSIRAIDGTNRNQITLYPNGNTYLSGVGTFNIGGGLAAGGLIKGSRLTAVNGVNHNIDFPDTFHDGGWCLQESTHADNAWAAIVTTWGTQHINGWVKATGFTATSDARHKSDLTPVRYDLSSISAYHYVLNDDGKPHVGLVAQEVQSVIPDAVSSDKDGTLSLDYNAITAALVEEVKDLKRRCDSLESEKVSLRAAVENLAEQKESLKKLVAAQEKANAMLASTVSALQNAIGAQEAKA